MSNIQIKKNDIVKADAIESALIQNDLSKLSTDERLAYYNRVCESVGLNPLTQPFAYIVLNEKLTLYAKKDASEQLRKIHGVSVSIKSKEIIGDVYMVHVEAKDKFGKMDEATGIVPIKKLKYWDKKENKWIFYDLEGNDLANAMMKAETKAKRRVTLSICGLGMIDETELADIAPEDKERAEQPQMKGTAAMIAEVKAEQQARKESKAVNAEIVASDEFEDSKENEDLGEYVAKGGKFKDQKLKDIDQFDLANYVAWIKAQVDAGKTMKPEMKELFEIAETYLCSKEFDADQGGDLIA